MFARAPRTPYFYSCLVHVRPLPTTRLATLLVPLSEQILCPRRFCPPGHNLLAEIVPHGRNPLADIVPLPQKLSHPPHTHTPFPPTVGDRYSNTYSLCLHCRCQQWVIDAPPFLIRIAPPPPPHKLTALPAFCIGPETYNIPHSFSYHDRARKVRIRNYVSTEIIYNPYVSTEIILGVYERTQRF